jgi:phosphate transport system substrate-binding protein
MKKCTPVALISLIIAIAVMSAGCTTSTNQTGTAGGKLQLAGSTSVQPHAEALAKAFMANNSGVQILVQGGGSSAGITAVGQSTADIGMSSRAIKDSEKAKYPVLQPVAIAVDGIAIIVHPSNPITNLTMNQTRDILTGNITNWVQVGGKNAPIDVVNREQGSGTRDGIASIVLNGGDTTSAGVTQSSNGAVRSFVAGDRNSIGYISAAELMSNVKAVSIDGVAPTFDNIANRTYKIQRDLYFITKGSPTGLEKSFLDYTLGSGGQALLKANGLVPITQAKSYNPKN